MRAAHAMFSSTFRLQSVSMLTLLLHACRVQQSTLLPAQGASASLLGAWSGRGQCWVVPPAHRVSMFVGHTLSVGGMLGVI